MAGNGPSPRASVVNGVRTPSPPAVSTNTPGPQDATRFAGPAAPETVSRSSVPSPPRAAGISPASGAPSGGSSSSPSQGRMAGSPSVSPPMLMDAQRTAG